MTITRIPQIEQVRNLLLDGWTCGTDLLAAHMPRYAARIHELKAQGWPIERRRCQNPWHTHRGCQYEWHVPEQGRLPWGGWYTDLQIDSDKENHAGPSTR